MRVLQGILLSLLFHFLLVWAAQYAVFLPKTQTSKPITVEILESQSETEKLKAKQIVRESLAPEKLKSEDTKDPLRFLSAQTQRVKQQTKALLSGMTKNRSAQNEVEKTPEQKPQPASSTKSVSKFRDHQGTLNAFLPQYKKTPNLPKDLHTDKGLSTIGEALPQDVAVGSFTALNTDRYLYYSFFSRIEELIRFRWESAIHDIIDSTPPDRFKFNASGLWNTNIEIWLKPSGEFHSAHLMKESGFRGFDQAAAQAFIQARLFPNPPKEMVEADGLIHLKYSFQVRYEPKVLVRSRE